MSVENAIAEHQPNTTSTGLNNLQAQLQYFYPNKHQLNTYVKDYDTFCFALTLKLK